jgi:hypothetical protein
MGAVPIEERERVARRDTSVREAAAGGGPRARRRSSILKRERRASETLADPPAFLPPAA